jgi:hypothetical protein
LIGAYKSYMRTSDNSLTSYSGAVPTGSISHADSVTYAKRRGTGYNIIDFEQHCMIALLFYAKYGNRNSQAILGAGNMIYTDTSGSTNALGNADTVAATVGHASFSGIEGIHGGASEWVGGVTSGSGQWTVNSPDGTTRSGNATAGTTTGWIITIAAAIGPYFDMIPTEVGGSATTYFTDYYQYGTGASRVLVRAFYNTGADGGVAYTRANHDSSSTNMYIASRLSFRGKLTEENDINTFVQLPLL